MYCKTVIYFVETKFLNYMGNYNEYPVLKGYWLPFQGISDEGRHDTERGV